MNVLFLERSGVDLYATLSASETSRNALRFYRPEVVNGGVLVVTASLGSALSLASELRWYVRRYMQGVLFEIGPGIYCTQRLAQEAYYDRSATLEPPWDFRRLYAIRDRVLTKQPLQPGMTVADCRDRYRPDDLLMEVWCAEEECVCRSAEEPDLPDEPGENKETDESPEEGTVGERSE
jgi:hypothetical protein